MPTTSYEIRRCASCGLRYPLTDGQTFGLRCPVCMGETRLLLRRNLIVEPQPDRPETDLTPNPSPKRRGELAVLLDNIRSAWNVGSIFRSADGFGFSHIFLCGITPTPENETVSKTSLGAEDSVTWSHHKDAVKLVKGLKKDNWHILGLEEEMQARSLRDVSVSNIPNQALLMVGNELTGLDPGLLALCDEVYQIPMRGHKKSFNVAIAFSIAAYQLTATTDENNSRRTPEKSRHPARTKYRISHRR